MDLFDYTQKKYWGAPWYPYWSLILATVLFGFFGGDHLWLRSPLSGMFKLIVNLFTFGIWYFYDIIQVLTEADAVQKYGLSAPLLGPVGIGAGMFRTGDEGETLGKSPLRYIAYIILLIVPFTFGVEYAVAGDIGGAAFKFITSLFWFILFPISILYTAINFVHGVFMPKSLFEQGTYHLFPASMFLGPRGTSAAGVLGPRDVPDPDATCNSTFSALFAPLVEIGKAAVQSITAPATAAVGAVSGAVSAVAKTVETGATVARTVVGTAGQVVEGVGALTSTLPNTIGQAVQQQATQALLPVSGIQSGGSASTAYSPTIGDWAIIAGMCGLFGYTAFTKYKEWSQKRKEKEPELYNGVPIPNVAP